MDNTVVESFETLLRAMAAGEPHKASGQKSASVDQALGEAPSAYCGGIQTLPDTSEDASR